MEVGVTLKIVTMFEILIVSVLGFSSPYIARYFDHGVKDGVPSFPDASWFRVLKVGYNSTNRCLCLLSLTVVSNGIPGLLRWNHYRGCNSTFVRGRSHGTSGSFW